MEQGVPPEVVIGPRESVRQGSLFILQPALIWEKAFRCLAWPGSSGQAERSEDGTIWGSSLSFRLPFLPKTLNRDHMRGCFVVIPAPEPPRVAGDRSGGRIIF